MKISPGHYNITVMDDKYYCIISFWDQLNILLHLAFE